MSKPNEMAEAIDRNFTSPNATDSNGENANVVDVLDKIGRALWCLSRRRGENDHFGAMEFLATETRAGLGEVAAALNNLAAAVRGSD